MKRTLFVLLGVVSTIGAGVYVVSYLDASSERQAASLFERAANSWGVDAGQYEAFGVRSNTHGVVVRTWIRRELHQIEGFDVTVEESLVCRWRRLNGSEKTQNIACTQPQ